MELWSEIRRRALTGEVIKREACRVYEIHWATLKMILAYPYMTLIELIQSHIDDNIDCSLSAGG